MPAFLGVKRKVYQKLSEAETSESKYWKSFHTSKENKLQSSPNQVEFHPTRSQYLVTCGTSVHLYDGKSDILLRSYSRFRDNAYSGKFRHDGKLICAGEKTGAVKVFDTKSKALLREMKGHTQAVRTIDWLSGGKSLVSGSDDKTVHVWDTSTGSVSWGGLSSDDGGHSDYIRNVCAHPLDETIFLSACYDKTVKLWDIRQKKCVVTYTHDYSVEKCLFSTLGNFVFTAGKNEVNVFSLTSGSTVKINTFQNHQKNISYVVADKSGGRMLSASLDGHVKVYSVQKMSLIHGMQFHQPISSLGLSHDSRKLVVGFVTGSLIAKNKKLTKESSQSKEGRDSSCAHTYLTTTKERIATLESNTGSLFFKNAMVRERSNSIGQTTVVEDYTIFAERTAQLKSYESMLKNFKYRAALDSALKTRNPVTIVTILEELSRRSGLSLAISGRDESSLEPLLSFASKYISNPRYSSLVTQIVHHVLDQYTHLVGHSDSIDELFLKLHAHVKREMDVQNAMKHTVGMIECVVHNSLNYKGNSTQNGMITDREEDSEEDEEAEEEEEEGEYRPLKRPNMKTK